MRRKWWNLWLVICLAGCLAYPAPQGALTSPLPAWQYADLRLIDPADGTNPAQDVIALYTRIVQENAQIRLDYLDYPQQADHDLNLYLDISRQTGVDFSEGNDGWDYQIRIPAAGTPQMITPDHEEIADVALRIERDTVLDRVVVSFHNASLPMYLPRADIWVGLTAPGQNELFDETVPVAWQAAPPPRLQVLVGFWNTFSATTPAQALRQWDGAHTGPNSARHGLSNLLAAVEQTHSPIILFDLKVPTALSALDHLGGLPLVRALSEKGLVHLPDVLLVGNPGHPRFTIPDWVYHKILSDNRDTAAAFGLFTSPILYTNTWRNETQIPGARLVFINDPGCMVRDRLSVGMVRGVKYLCVYGYAQSANRPEDVNSNGLTIQAQKRLADQAAKGTREIFFLGGDLANSSWGEPTAAVQALSYIAEHPWLELLDPDALLTFHALHVQPVIQDIPETPATLYTPSGERLASGLNSAQLHEEVIRALRAAQPGTFSELAWQMYEMLLSPGSEELYDLRLGYLGQIGHLLAANRWMAEPQTGADCSQDLDWDGVVECTLASERFFAVFELEGGGITVAAARTPNSFTQVIAPTYQFTVGMSDPSIWDAKRGMAGDPAQLIAFTETGNQWERLEADTGEGEIQFSLGSNAIKTYQLTQNGLQIIFHDAGFHSVAIPIVLNTGSRFEQNWSSTLVGVMEKQAFRWSRAGETTIQINSDGQITPLVFNESKELLSQPEDPNYPYPTGHYIPFPLALVRVEAQGPLQIELIVLEP